MSEDRNFLSRWSRKKREAEDVPAPDAKDSDSKEGEAVTTAENAAAKKTDKDEPKFDLASLPSLDSITADTDIRPFLLPGVPAELTRAALRRGWMADPAIRDFVGLAENSWDFTKPGGVPGFDLSDPGVDVKRLAEELFGAKPKPAGEKSPEPKPLSTEGEKEEPTRVPDRPDAVASSSDHDMLKPPADSVSKGSERVAEQGPIAAREKADTAVQHGRETEAVPKPVRKRHGGALPS